ncbi:hypothetical protein GY45DRAFT_1310841 [Cubamyces sp. BRFM 1775]|nr:hypothetical protein GY45DRAFT_1310841 [Cubamyces sp. BRFM 1775]
MYVACRCPGSIRLITDNTILTGGETLNLLRNLRPPTQQLAMNPSSGLPLGPGSLSPADETFIPWKGSRADFATIELNQDPTYLRWVNDEFLFFVDIPCTRIENNGASSSDSSPIPRRIANDAAHVPIRNIIMDLLEDLMNRTMPDHLVFTNSMDPQSATISGDRLAMLIVPWARKLTALRVEDPAPFRGWGETVRSRLLTAIETIENHIYPRISSLIDHQSPQAAMFYGLLTFLSSLARCMQAVWEDSAPAMALEGESKMYREAVDIFQSKLHENWGAQFRVATCQLGGGLPFLAYSVTCQPTTNRVLTVDTETYKPQHVTTGCTCSFVQPPITEIRALLQNNEILALIFDGEGIVVRSTSAGPYVAISHVWADGLGSVAEAGLPICQVQRISGGARELVQDGAFWLDSLSVPAERDLRRKAIVLMAKTYEQADKVLVVDGGVRSQCSLSSPKEECILRIATSGWMQRIWTLQEGMLARELHFVLSDGIVDCTFFNGFAFRAAIKIIPLLEHRPRDDDARCFKSSTTKPVRCSLNDLIPLLRYRSTSKPEDEPLAISGLLGVDAAKLVNLKTGEERMKALLIEVGTFNRQLGVHGWFCDRLSLPNFTWAPTSLSELLWPGDPLDSRVATCTEEGLFGEYCVIHFTPTLLGINYGVVVVVDSEGGAHDSTSGSRDDAEPRRVFNLILSPYLFRAHQLDFVVCNAIIIKNSIGSQKLRDEGVAAVFLDPPDGHTESYGGNEPLHCRFVACGSASDGYPDIVETTRARNYWAHVRATELQYKGIRLN